MGSIVVRPYLPYGQNDTTAYGGDDNIAFGDMMLQWPYNNTPWGSIVLRPKRPYGPSDYNASGVVDHWCFAPVVQLAFGELNLF